MADKQRPQPKRGDMLVTDGDGEKWGPLACSAHTPDPATGEAPAGQTGYQPNCEACGVTFALTLEHFDAAQRGRGHTVRE